MDALRRILLYSLWNFLGNVLMQNEGENQERERPGIQEIEASTQEKVRGGGSSGRVVQRAGGHLQTEQEDGVLWT